ncbi:MAG: DUF29 domain-containing protein [Methylacidiphilaceae bacterium]|nr:DUF29 domain-containing protein [Candidatus Methylacidiphilaceae bacterium]
MTAKELYELDFYAWTQETARLLREGRFEKVDIKNLVEEVEDLGKSERNRLEGRLEALIQHLLYIAYLTRDPERHGHGWRHAVERARDKALRVLKEKSQF